ncbi:MAG: alpha/beta hydrolase [Myxococcales bacterium]
MFVPALNTSLVRPKDTEASHSVLILHGILGSGSNLRSLAQRLVQADPGLSAVLVDLRLHGRSQNFPEPHSVQACADDLVRLIEGLPTPVTQVLGHSFGGKVALAFHAQRPDLERVMLLDSMPGARENAYGSEQTYEILSLLERLPGPFATREMFLERVVAEGQSRPIAEWLGMNLERTSEGFRLRLDTRGIRELLSDYFSLDLWPVIEGSQARVDVVIGGRSAVWRAEDRARFERLAASHPKQFRLHVLPQAGHWVHVDDFEGLSAALTS